MIWTDISARYGKEEVLVLRRKIWVLMVSMMLIMTSIPWGTVTAETEQDNRAGTGQVQLKTAESDTAASSDAVKQEDPGEAESEQKESDPKPAEEKKEDAAEKQQKDAGKESSAPDPNTANKKYDQSDQESSGNSDGSAARKEAAANKGLKLDSEPGDKGEEETENAPRESLAINAEHQTIQHFHPHTRHRHQHPHWCYQRI